MEEPMNSENAALTLNNNNNQNIIASSASASTKPLIGGGSNSTSNQGPIKSLGPLKSFNASQWGGGTQTQQVDKQDQRLSNACRNGDLEEARAALQAGANPSVQFRLALGEITPIFLCASKGYIEIAKLLIKYHADINRRMDFDGTICLHHAASNGEAKMCEFLIEKGCRVDANDKLGRTPLMDAAEIGNVEVIQVLIDNGADVNASDRERHTALSYCIDFINSREPQFFDAAWKLVENGANPNFSGKFANRTLLHCAAAQGKMKEVQALVEQYDAMIQVFDNDNKSPIEYASEQNHTEIAEYLNQKYIEQNPGCCVIL